MKKLIILLIFFQLSPAFGQKDKKTEKAIKKFNSGKFDKAIGMMNKLTSANSTEYRWDVSVTMHQKRLEYANEQAQNVASTLFMQSLGVRSKPKTHTSLRICYDELILKCKEASLYSQSPTASMCLRLYLVDIETDTAVSKEARKEFKTAEKYFRAQEYHQSKIHYTNALRLQPDYYQATIYLGDSYWFLEQMDSAIYYFRIGIKMYPNLLEPRKYLVDALAHSKRYEDARKECIETMFIYPDESMFIKLTDIQELEKKRFNRHWVKRGCEINTIGDTKKPATEQTWIAYQNAKSEISSYCDSNGVIVKPNKLTTSKYLEVYSWEKMLNSTSQLPANLDFAKKMADEGYLDCYVFISAFHYDFYQQFKEFSKNNEARIKTYIETYLAN